MPVWLQNLTWINPIRHFTDITKQIYLKDAESGYCVEWFVAATGDNGHDRVSGVRDV